MIRNLSVRKKIIVLFIITGLLPVIVVGWLTYAMAENNIRDAIFKGNDAFLKLTVSRLNNYFNEQMDDGWTFASSESVYKEFRTYFEIGENSDEWKEAYTKLDEYASTIALTYDYNDIFLTDLSGKVIYGVSKKSEGTNLFETEYIKTGLSGKQNWSEPFYSDIMEANVMILSTPIYRNGISGPIIGTMNISIGQHEIDRIVHDNIDVLGESGDSYLVNEDGLLLTNTKLGDYTHDAALKVTINTEGVSMLKEAISNNDMDFEDTEEYADYLGNPVLGSLGVVEMGDKAVGLIIEIDHSEAFGELIQFKTFLFAGGAFILILGIILALYFSGVIAKPIQGTNNMLKDIAEGEGDLTKELTVGSKDEVGTLSKWFNIFVSKIRALIIDVSDNASGVSSSSYQLAAAMEQANKGMESIAEEMNIITDGLQNNASTIEEATASIQEILSGTMVISQESENASKNSEDVLDAANAGAEKLSQVVDAMNKVKESSDNTGIVVQDLNSFTSEIGEIVTLITNISEQINLLALNAAIEAARAGEHGQGFAVVADEVRKLAEESRSSADNITTLIDGIKGKIEDANLSMDEEKEIVAKTLESTNDTNEEFSRILKLIEEITGKIKTIYGSAVQQSEITEDMTKAMDQISETTQSSAISSQQISAAVEEQVSTFEEIGASVEELNHMSQKLKEQTDKFKTE